VLNNYFDKISISGYFITVSLIIFRRWSKGSEKRRSRGGGQLTLNTMQVSKTVGNVGWPQIEGGGASAVCGESATATTTEGTRG
jgi:hypothetical protein